MEIVVEDKNDTFWEKSETKRKPRKALKVLIVIFASILVIFAGLTFVALSQNAKEQPVATNENSTIEALKCKFSDPADKNIVSLINEYRADQSLPLLKESDALNKFQGALLPVIVSSTVDQHKELFDINSWQENNLPIGSRNYIDSNFKVIAANKSGDPCVMVSEIISKNNSDIFSKEFETIGISSNANVALLIFAKNSSESGLAVANTPIMSVMKKDESSSVPAATTQDTNKLENRYKEFLSQISIAIAYNNLKNNSRPTSASCSKAGSVSFGYVSDRIVSASTQYGTISFSIIGNQLTSASGLGTYTCSSVGDEISSCNSINGFVSISKIGNNISSMSNYLSNVMSHYSYVGGNITSADEADLGSCKIN
jgi:hypothetical protein